MRLLALLLVCACAAAPDAGEETADLGLAAGFPTTHAPWGGWGGASNCTAKRTPVILLHGNTESASDWLRPASNGGPSVPATLFARGYSACEVFAVTWLPPSDRSVAQDHNHDAAQADQVAGFIADVLAYTRYTHVDLIGHSMGTSVGLHALERNNLWSKARTFISLAGGLRGLSACVPWGPANPLTPACWAQSLFDPDVFGFYPTSNWRMQPGGYRDAPAQHPATQFYSLRAGTSDEVLCPSCETALFDAAPNVRAQLDVGSGTLTKGTHDDLGKGVGHFRVRLDTGVIQANLLAGCSGAACCNGYAARCVP